MTWASKDRKVWIDRQKQETLRWGKCISKCLENSLSKASEEKARERRGGVRRRALGPAHTQRPTRSSHRLSSVQGNQGRVGILGVGGAARGFFEAALAMGRILFI